MTGDRVVEYREFVRSAEINNTSLIPLACSLLDSVGIRHFICDERSHDLVGYARLSQGGYNVWWLPTVYVDPARAEEAVELLRDLTDEIGGDAIERQLSHVWFRMPSRSVLIGVWMLFGGSVANAAVFLASTQTKPGLYLSAFLVGGLIAAGCTVLRKVTSNYFAQSSSSAKRRVL